MRASSKGAWPVCQSGGQNGTIVGSLVVPDSGSCNTGGSSIRFKKDVISLKPAVNLDQVLAMRPVSFYYKPSFSKERAWQVGFIAEEINKIEPRAINYEDDGVTPYGIDFEKLLPSIVGAIKQLKKIIDGIADDVAEIKDHLFYYVDPELEALKEANERQAAEIAALKADNDNEAAQIQTLTGRLDAIEAKEQ
jgi:hypothetical protein